MKGIPFVKDDRQREKYSKQTERETNTSRKPPKKNNGISNNNLMVN